MSWAPSEIQILWAAAESVTVTVNGQATSDPFLPPSNAIGEMLVSVYAQALTGPSVADSLYLKLMQSAGDANRLGGDDYTTPGHAPTMLVLNLNTENPAVGHFYVRRPQKAFQLYADGQVTVNVNEIQVWARVFMQLDT